MSYGRAFNGLSLESEGPGSSPETAKFLIYSYELDKLLTYVLFLNGNKTLLTTLNKFKTHFEDCFIQNILRKTFIHFLYNVYS